VDDLVAASTAELNALVARMMAAYKSEKEAKSRCKRNPQACGPSR
jgi:hypothetical protein